VRKFVAFVISIDRRVNLARLLAPRPDYAKETTDYRTTGVIVCRGHEKNYRAKPVCPERRQRDAKNAKENFSSSSLAGFAPWRETQFFRPLFQPIFKYMASVSDVAGTASGEKAVRTVKIAP
jgi:hypothetical protein